MSIEDGAIAKKEYLGLLKGLRTDLYRIVGVEEQAVVRFKEEYIWKGGYYRPNIDGLDMDLLVAFNETQRGSTMYLAIQSSQTDKVLILTSEFSTALVAYERYSTLNAVVTNKPHTDRVFMAFRATLEDLEEFQRVGRVAGEIDQRGRDG